MIQNKLQFHTVSVQGSCKKATTEVRIFSDWRPGGTADVLQQVCAGLLSESLCTRGAIIAGRRSEYMGLIRCQIIHRVRSLMILFKCLGTVHHVRQVVCKPRAFYTSAVSDSSG